MLQFEFETVPGGDDFDRMGVACDFLETARLGKYCGDLGVAIGRLMVEKSQAVGTGKLAEFNADGIAGMPPVCFG